MAGKRLLFKSAAREKILSGATAHAPCAVEIVRPRTDRETAVVEKGMKVLVATDGS
jgi:hypothetical protein